MGPPSALESAQIVVYACLAAAALRVHLRARTSASAWLLASMGLLAAVVLTGAALPARERWQGTVADVVHDLRLMMLLSLPYLLHRFSGAFGGQSRSERRAATASFAAVCAATVLLPELPAEGAPRPAWLQAYVAGALAYWTALSVRVAWQLWRAGAGEPTAVRRRMRLLGAAALVLTAALLLIGVSADSAPEATRITVQSLALVSPALFLLGFAPPAFVRRSWRRREEAALRRAEASLMAAISEQEVVAGLLPHVSDVLGGNGAALLDRDLRVRGVERLEPPVLEAVTAALRARPPRDLLAGSGWTALSLHTGWLVAGTTRYTPFFGSDEVSLLRGLGTSVDLALARVRLFGSERAARAELERANEEISALVYGISHDLRNPVVTVLGYLEVLTSEHGELLHGDARRYVERIAANAQYMDDLITDLLELSRLTRTQTDTEPVALADVARGIAAELGRTHPAARFEVVDLPVVSMNPRRATQLLTNLLQNAVRHGRHDATVRLSSQASADGGVELVVRDDGVGIPAAYRERVFEIFERLDGRSEAPGTGIGLAVCRRIVEQLGGRIWIADSASGTEFRVAVPAAAVVAARAVEEAAL